MNFTDLCVRNMEIMDLCSRNTKFADLCARNTEFADLCGRNMEIMNLCGRNMEFADLCVRNIEIMDLCGKNTELRISVVDVWKSCVFANDCGIPLLFPYTAYCYVLGIVKHIVYIVGNYQGTVPFLYFPGV